MKTQPPYMQECALEQLEVVAVQLDQCRKLIEQGIEAHSRVALLLADNAAELIMRRQVIQALQFNHLYEKYPEMQDLPPDHELRAKIGDYVNEKRERKIEHNFREKVRFLVERGIIDPVLGAGLQKLHVYRNEAQHQDKLRSATIGPAARIYFDMACTLLASYKPMVLFYRAVLPGQPEGTEDWFGSNYPTVAALVRDQPATRYEVAVAEQLRGSIAPDDLGALRQSLEQHLSGRIDEMERDLKLSQESVDLFEGWKPADMLRMAQMLAEAEKQNREPQLTLEQMRGRSWTYKLLDFERWRAEIADLSGLTDRNSLFAAFARIEDELEPCHAMVADLAEQVDRIVEDIGNFIRGK